MHASDIERIREYGRTLAVEGPRTLKLLKDIDDTISNVRRMAAHMSAEVEYGEQLLAELIATPHARVQDEDRVAETLAKAEDSIARVHSLLLSKCEAARKAPELREDDGVAEAYDEAIAAAAMLHDVMERTRWTILELKADQEEPIGEVITDPEQLRAYLKSLA